MELSGRYEVHLVELHFTGPSSFLPY
uniref:Uncharacterized protein n=1 Tax=Rhizophora mucronata TaxID=61149 RepID=A0A2P2R5G2_RHIMU